MGKSSSASIGAESRSGSRRHNGIWRLHSAFDLPAERFGQFVLTDRIAVIRGEIRIADRVHLQPNRVANVLDQGGDVVLRAAWRNVRWQQQDGERLDLLKVFRDNATGRIDQSVWIARKGGDPLALRLIAVRKSDAAAAESRRKARRQAQKDGYQVSQETLAAADWFILVTSLPVSDFTTDDVLTLYRLRWRVELGFKRLKSVIGLHGPPGIDERSARPYVLAHLLMLLLLEPSMNRRASSSGRMVRPERTGAGPSFLPERPVEHLDTIVLPGRPQSRDRLCRSRHDKACSRGSGVRRTAALGGTGNSRCAG